MYHAKHCSTAGNSFTQRRLEHLWVKLSIPKMYLIYLHKFIYWTKFNKGNKKLKKKKKHSFLRVVVMTDIWKHNASGSSDN